MIKPYGSETLINRYIKNFNEDDINNIKKGSYAMAECDEDMLIECLRIADGSLTPIDGFANKEELDSIINCNKLLIDVYFPIPILFQIEKEMRGMEKQRVFLKFKDNIIGYIENAEIFEYDLLDICKFIFGTLDSRHPGVNKMLSKGNTFMGGKLHLFDFENKTRVSKYCLKPEDIRKEIHKNGWKTCAGFQTRNVPHRAHEYLQRTAMELLDGILIHPIIGWKKKDDYLPEVVMEAYDYMSKNIYPYKRVILSGLQLSMRYAGPKEAVFHSIVRQNYGCTHFIVGRDHAGVGNYYGIYEAHNIFETIEQHLEIEILKLKGPYYCSKCQGIATENTCGHKNEDHIDISGTLIRKIILSGENPPENIIRKEIVDVIRSFKDIFVE